MFGRGLGGIEQAFLDYNDALLMAGHDVLAVTHPLAAINAEISGNLTHETLGNRGSWDIIAARKLQRLYRSWKPDVIISHGNRAIALNLLTDADAFHIGVTHNYHLRRFAWLDGVLATTQDLQNAAINAGVEPVKIQQLPNMVRIPERTETPRHTPVVIGAMGRMVEKKGFHLLLEAAAHLLQREIGFKLLIGGTGPQESKLKALCRQLKLEDHVEFQGWVSDKAAFFRDIDIFCLPSLHEPFGIVLLEAMASARPVVGYISEGPAEIIKNAEAILVENGNPTALANALAQAITSPDCGAQLGRQGRDFVASRYALPVISQQLNNIIQEWCGDLKNQQRLHTSGA